MKEKRIRPLFNCRLDEVAPLARLQWASYQRDRAEFVDLLPDDYTDTFDAAFPKKLEAVEKLVVFSVQQAKGMVFTAAIQAQYDELPKLLNRLDARVNRAVGLTVPAKKFGVADARAARNDDDKEALAGDLKTLLQNIAENKEALLAKGHKPADTQAIQDIYDALVSNATDQGTNTSTMRQLVQDNVGTINALEADMQHLFNDGKAIFEHENPAKLKDYTYRQLLKRVRQAKAKPAGPVALVG